MDYNLKRCGLWFGTENRMLWMPTPNSGADSTPTGWNEDGTLANGGGYSFSSFGSHKRYTYDWPVSSSREVAQLMKSFADGSYGRGLLYFISPLSYNTNMLPARVADPSMAVGYEGGSLCYGVEPTSVPVAPGNNMYPAYSTTYDLRGYHAGFRKEYGAVFLPIPEGYTLWLGAAYTRTGSGGVFASPQAAPGSVGPAMRLTQLSPSEDRLIADSFSGVSGVWLWVGKTATDTSSVTLRGMTGRLIPTVQSIVRHEATNLFTNPNLLGDETWRTKGRNLFTNPNLVGDGTWAEVRRNYVTEGAFTSVGRYDIEPEIVNGDVWYRVTQISDHAERRIFMNTGVNPDVPVGAALEVWNTLDEPMAFYLQMGSSLNNGPTEAFNAGERRRVEAYWPSTAGNQRFNPVLPNNMVQGDSILVRFAQVENTASLGPYFDGSSPDFSVDPDMRTRWLGDENASESVMEIERVRGLTSTNCIMGVSSRGGKPAARQISLAGPGQGSNAFFDIPSIARPHGTLVATAHFDEPITWAHADRVMIAANGPRQESESNPSAPGTYLRRVEFSDLTSAYRAYFYHGGTQGSGDVWWSDIGLFAGTYDGSEAFSGDTESERPEWRYSWEGEPDNSVSVWEEKGTWAPVYENLFTNPRLKGDGTWAEARRNYKPQPIASSSWALSGGGGTVTNTLVPDDRFPSGVAMEGVQVTAGSGQWMTLGSGVPDAASKFLAGDYLMMAVRVAVSDMPDSGLHLTFAGTGFVGVEELSRGVYDHGDGSKTVWIVRQVTIPSHLTPMLTGFGARPAGSSIRAGGVQVEKLPTWKPYFDGLTEPATAEGIVQPEDFRWRWLGEPNASESVMEIERVGGLSGNGVVPGLSTWGGRPSVRMIATGSTASSRAYFTIPEEARISGTGLASVHVVEPVGAPISARLSVGSLNPSTFTAAPENLPGSYSLRHGFSDLTGTYQMSLWLGALRGEVWWTDIGLYAGEYDGEAFNGSSDPAETGLAQPEDFRIRWTGAVDNSTSVMEIERVAGLTGANSIAGVSSWDGKPAVRLIPTGTSSSTYVRMSIPVEARASGTLLGTLHQLAPLTGPTSVARGYLYANAPQQNAEINPNEGGSFPKRVAFSNLTADFQMYLWHGGAQGSGDVWWTDIGLFAGTYDGPAFGGDTRTSQGVQYSWNGTPNNSTSDAVYTSFQLSELQKGPWIGGQGHSGARFLGKPTYIEYTGVNGGQVGFAASFVEVGSWSQG